MGLVAITSSIACITARIARVGSGCIFGNSPRSLNALRSYGVHDSSAGHWTASTKHGAFDWNSSVAVQPAKCLSCAVLSLPRSPEPCRNTMSGSLPSAFAIASALGSTRR